MSEETKPRSTLAQVRDLAPHRALTPGEARQVLERQATRLLKLSGIAGPPVPVEQIVASLPRIEVRRHADLPTSGRTQWTGTRWVILLDSGEARVRQRFSLGHELAHVIYHPLAGMVLPDRGERSAEERLEQACEYFAACLLMPRLWIKRAYFDESIQDVPSLARLFSVSWVALRLRLEQLGLVARVSPDNDTSRRAA
jgi:predicted transcriptional regulator